MSAIYFKFLLKKYIFFYYFFLDIYALMEYITESLRQISRTKKLFSIRNECENAMYNLSSCFSTTFERMRVFGINYLKFLFVLITLLLREKTTYTMEQEIGTWAIFKIPSNLLIHKHPDFGVSVYSRKFFKKTSLHHLRFLTWLRSN